MATDLFYEERVPEHVPQELVHDLNIYDYGDENPLDVISRLQKVGLPELFWTRHNGGHWVAFGADVITDIAKNPNHFSSDRPLVPDSRNFPEPILFPLNVDPPLHAGYRSVVAPLLAPKRIAALEERAREYAQEVASRISERGECEFIEDFANEMPIVVFLNFLDLPLDDRWELTRLAGALVKPSEGGHRSDPIEQLIGYLKPIIEERAANPGSDVISELVNSTISDMRLSGTEMLNLSLTVLVGGLETTTSTLGYIAHYLAENPEARCRLRENKKLIPHAVEELLRRFPVTSPGRRAIADVVFRNVAIRQNDHVAWHTGMFNLDERRFRDPLTVDFDRKRDQHSTFGVGIHFCVGSFLARLQIGAFIDRWLEEIPNFHVAPGAALEHRTRMSMSLVSLPLIIDRDVPCASDAAGGSRQTADQI